MAEKPNAQEQLRKVVERAKNLNTYPGITWDDFVWNVTAFENAPPHQKKRLVLCFTARRSSRSAPNIPYEKPYADFAKAYVRIRASERGITHAGQAHTMITLRYLYEALQLAGKDDPTTLTRKHFNVAVVNAQKSTSAWTLYHIGKTLQRVSDWVDDNNLARTWINFKNPIKCPDRGDGLDPESQAKGLLKMPSVTALNALAEISNNPLDDNERTLLRVVDLLAVGGFRIGEVLSLPLNCWVESPVLHENGRVKTDPITGTSIIRYGIRYWPEKGGDPYVKWLSDVSMPLARRAVDDLTKLCAEARAAAKILEEVPDCVPLPKRFAPDELIDLKQVAEITGLKSPQTANAFIKGLGLKPTATNKPNGQYAFLFRVKDIEKALVKRRHNLVISRKPNGQAQMLSESLCVMFQNQFHASQPTFKFLPELIGIGQINDALGNDADQVSVFSVRGLTEPDGSPMRIKTHAFRHWLNTLMSRGGLSDVELARWSGRRNINQNAAYKHGTVEQRVSWAQEMIKAGELRGLVADTYHSIDDPVEKQYFLETFVNVALFTPYGVCVHDYSIDPCPYHLNCLSGCPEYLRTKGDIEEQKNIAEVLNFHLVQLQRSNKAEQEGLSGAGNYMTHCKRIVEGAKAALSVDGIESPDGQLVKVFPNNKSLRQQSKNRKVKAWI